MLVILETGCDPLKIKKVLMKLGFDSMEYSENMGFASVIVIALKIIVLVFRFLRKITNISILKFAWITWKIDGLR